MTSSRFQTVSHKTKGTPHSILWCHFWLNVQAWFVVGCNTAAGQSDFETSLKTLRHEKPSDWPAPEPSYSYAASKDHPPPCNVPVNQKLDDQFLAVYRFFSQKRSSLLACKRVDIAGATMEKNRFDKSHGGLMRHVGCHPSDLHRHPSLGAKSNIAVERHGQDVLTALSRARS